jgi:hypothetical protein
LIQTQSRRNAALSRHTHPILIMTTESIDLCAIWGLVRDAARAELSAAYRTPLTSAS